MTKKNLSNQEEAVSALQEVEDIMESFKKTLTGTNKLGVDMGNGFFKSDTGTVLRATFSSDATREKIMVTDSKCLAIKHGGKLSVIGNPKAKAIRGIDKVNTEEYKICLATVIAKSYMDAGHTGGEINVNLAIGIPIEQFVEYEEPYKANALSIKNVEIIIDNIRFIVTVDSCEVNPQSNIADCIDNVEFPVLVIDIGNGTLDVSKYREEENGNLSLDLYRSLDHAYSDIIDKLVNEFAEVGYDEGDIISFIDKKFKCNDEKLQKIVDEEYLKLITSVRELRPGFFNSVVLCGGPAQSFLNTVKTVFPEQSILLTENPQFQNAIAYRLYLDM